MHLLLNWDSWSDHGGLTSSTTALSSSSCYSSTTALLQLNPFSGLLIIIIGIIIIMIEKKKSPPRDLESPFQCCWYILVKKTVLSINFIPIGFLPLENDRLPYRSEIPERKVVKFVNDNEPIIIHGTKIWGDINQINDISYAKVQAMIVLLAIIRRGLKEFQ